VTSRLERLVRRCYAGWSRRYFRDYYGARAPYPPVHRRLIRRLLAGARTVLDAGCGPASMMRDLAAAGFDVRGFDLADEMVAEARRVLASRGLDPARVWTGSVTAPSSFGRRRYDAVVCAGVLPHVPEGSDLRVLRNLRGTLRPGGRAIVEARNRLFALFTLNRYSYDLFVQDLVPPALRVVARRLRPRFRMDLPPVRPGYDQILSRTHNPLVLKAQMERAGFRDVRLHFYHYHALPPMLEASCPAAFRRASLTMEKPDDWRGLVMASAFLATGVRP
jgi:2-polyprenyl-3-methyl-5-hydroxy-6-metoxy-1,4-benzoquinol methylase